MEVPPQCRFPVPTGDHGVDVAEILAWHRHVLEFIASEAGQSVSEDARLHVQVRGLPDVSGAPAAAHDRILRWRDNLINWYVIGLDLIWIEPSDDMPTLAGWGWLSKFLRPIDAELRCDRCLETDHIEDCPLVEVWYPELARRRPPTTRPPRTPRPSPPRFAELLVLSPRRWWQFWRR